MDRTQRISETIVEEIGAIVAQVAATIGLLDSGATVPFVARYRKEATGSVGDAQLRLLAERLGYLRGLDDRRSTILRSIHERGKLSEALSRVIETAETKSRLEDIYLPFRPKRRSKAAIARENGLGPLRDAIMTDRAKDPADLARSYLNAAVPTEKEALNGARDILVEELSETVDLLGDLRGYLRKNAIITAKVIPGQETAGAKFSDYFDHSEAWATMPLHSVLALLRAHKAGVIRFDIGPDKESGAPRCEAMVAARLRPSGDGPGAFEQCAGFLCIRDGKEPLDASAVHPEAYDLARRIVADCGRDLRGLQSSPDALRGIRAEDYADARFGVPTVRDILSELEKPGRDPRPSFGTASFAEGVEEIGDLREGMRLEGTGTNVAAFGAFVDISVHQDGLVYVSQLADRFAKDPHEVVQAGDVVQVRVTDVDVARKRIGLSRRKEGGEARGERRGDAPRRADRKGQVDAGGGCGRGRGDAGAGAIGAALQAALK